VSQNKAEHLKLYKNVRNIAKLGNIIFLARVGFSDLYDILLGTRFGGSGICGRLQFSNVSSSLTKGLGGSPVVLNWRLYTID
jgi:hypothetical protein